MPWVLGMQCEQGRQESLSSWNIWKTVGRRQLNKEVTERDACYKGTRKRMGRVIRRGEDCK